MVLTIANRLCGSFLRSIGESSHERSVARCPTSRMSHVASGRPVEFTEAVVERRFEGLVREHQRAVFAYARSMTRSTALAEEATQDTFVRAWKYLDSFRGDGSLEGWLIRICRNCVFDLVQRESRADIVSLQPVVEAPDHRADIYGFLDGLSPADREILMICGVLGFDYDSASEILDIPIGTVRSRLSRARVHLGDAMREADVA